MPHNKIDGVIEAVRYTPEGQISLVRTYERRGAVWSDHILLGRAELVERLSHGRHFVTGTRKTSLGSLFETGAAINYVNQNIVTGGQSAVGDRLSGVPVF